jgi:hypothetical protein
MCSFSRNRRIEVFGKSGSKSKEGSYEKNPKNVVHGNSFYFRVFNQRSSGRAKPIHGATLLHALFTLCLNSLSDIG